MELLQFWFDSEQKWFCTDNFFDKIITEKFNTILETKRQILQNILQENLQNIIKYDNKEELLELIILFDQISRNIFRINSHEYRKLDDEIALKLVNQYIQNFGIPSKQIELYFIVLPLRHTKSKEYCTRAIEIIKSFNKINITDEQKWNNFVCASYRSLYNSTSFIEKNLKIISIDEFKHSYLEYKDIIDEKILSTNSIKNFNQNYTKNIIFDEILKDITKNECKNLCVSLSGGVDSMVIVHALSTLKLEFEKNGRKLEIYAVHIHHFNRNEAELEAKMIEKFCNLLKVKYFQINIEHIKRGEINREFYENETKRIRFDFYRNMILHHNIDYIALGHHRGDISENVLTNLIKGRSLTDLPVMKRIDFQEGVTIWRPFIDIPKSYIWDYAFEYGIIYTKNCTPEWSVRGKFRNILFPLLDTMFNSVEENLYNAGKESRELSEYIERNVIDKIIKNVYHGKYGFYIPMEFLNDINFTIFKLTLQKIFHSKQIKMLKDSAIRNLVSFEQKIYKLCKDFLIYNDGNKLIFINESIFLSETSYEITTEFLNEMFTVEDFLNGNLCYNIYYNTNYSKGKIPKNMKRIFNKILPLEILNKFIWITSETKNKNNLGKVGVKFVIL
jgi:tRNA(Ile)-lysidine synthetase-like protein